MITIFSIPKPFVNEIRIIQRNAIQSWLSLLPACELILFGDGEGTAEAADEFDIIHVPEVEKNEYGTPLLNSAFEMTRKLAKNNILVYVNSDILFMSNIYTAIEQIHFKQYLLVGRRIDLDIKGEMVFETNWEDSIDFELRTRGKLHGYSGIDYFVFPKNSPFNLPEFAVGRQGWDNWLLWDARTKRIPVIDATESITAVHQNHDFSHSQFEEKKRVGGPEVDINLKLAGGFSHLLTLRDADWMLDKRGVSRSKYPGRIFSILSLWYPWQMLLSFKRSLNKYIFKFFFLLKTGKHS